MVEVISKKRTTRIAAALVIVILSLSACAPAASQQTIEAKKTVADTLEIKHTGKIFSENESPRDEDKNPIAHAPSAPETINEPSKSTPHEPSKTEKASIKNIVSEPNESKLKSALDEKDRPKLEEIHAPEPSPQPQPEAKAEPSAQEKTTKPAPENEMKPIPETLIQLDFDALCRYAIDYAVVTYGYEYWPGMRDGYYPAATFKIETTEQGQQRVRECVDDLTQELEARGEPIVAYVDGVGYGVPFDVEIQPDPDGYTDSYIIQLYY